MTLCPIDSSKILPMETLILYILSFVLAVLGIGIIVFGYLYAALLSKYNQLQKQNLYLRFHVQEKSLQKVNKAKERSLEIIADAAMQAEALLQQAELFKSENTEHTKSAISELKSKQKEALLKASDDLRREFDEAIKHLQEEDINLLRNITKDIENIASENIKTFENRLQAETVGQQLKVDEQIKEAFLKANQTIEDYKKEKMTELDARITALVIAVTKDVIKKELDNDDHRSFILSALQKAKQEMIEFRSELQKQ